MADGRGLTVSLVFRRCIVAGFLRWLPTGWRVLSPDDSRGIGCMLRVGNLSIPVRSLKLKPRNRTFKAWGYSSHVYSRGYQLQNAA